MNKVWHIYILVWLLYVGFASVAGQAEALERGQFAFSRLGFELLSVLPIAAVLALVWPLSARLEQRNLRGLALFLFHFAGALVFAGLWHLFDHELIRSIQGGQRLSFFRYLWAFYFSMMMYGAMAGISHSVRAGAARQQQALAAAQAQSLLMSAELAALRNKLNPHFLFNTLHSIIALVRKDPLSAEAALFRFSDMLRYLLETEKSGKQQVTLEEELDFVRDYLNLEALRLGPRLQVQWALDPAANHRLLPALSLQPLVENSIKHAINPRSQGGVLQISSRLDLAQQQFCVSVRDDGPGCDPAQLAQASGMGVATVRRRLELEYRGRAALEIQSAPGQGFSCELRLPLTPDYTE